VAGSCEYGDEPSGSGATELVRLLRRFIICNLHQTTREMRWTKHVTRVRR
jgi:hypothetical protein